jgi:hypothetical protein
MSDFVFQWDAPSFVTVRCEMCDEEIIVDWGQSIDELVRYTEEHVHITTNEEMTQ